MPSSSVRMWPRWTTGTPTLPTSPRGHRRVGVVAGLRRQVEGDRQPGLALGQVRAVQLVRRRRASSGPSTCASATVRRARSWRQCARRHGRATSCRPPSRVGRGTRARDSSTAPSERRCGVIHCTSSSSAAGVAEPVDEGDERDLRGVGGGVEHRLAGEEAADAHAVEAADELAVVVEALDASAPSRAGAGARRP